ncbi:MAG: DegT/DnrJ/EryC1/StrS family aminotransferase, partial [Pirellulaceae bacterium]
AEWCATYARHGGKGNHVMEGINSRMDGLHAAILSVELPHLDHWTRRRQEVAANYDTLLNGIPGIQIPKIATDRTHVYHLYVIRSVDRDNLQRKLASAGISTVLNYP